MLVYISVEPVAFFSSWTHMSKQLWHNKGLILNVSLLPILVHYMRYGIVALYTLCSALDLHWRAIWNSAYNGAWSVNDSAWSFLKTKS